MKFKVKVIPNAKKIKVSLSDDSTKVCLTTPPEDNKANKQLKKILAEYFKLKRRKITLIAGQKSRNKLVEVDKEFEQKP